MLKRTAFLILFSSIFNYTAPGKVCAGEIKNNGKDVNSAVIVSSSTPVNTDGSEGAARSDLSNLAGPDIFKEAGSAAISPTVSINQDSIDLAVDWNNPFHAGETTMIRYTIPPGFDEEVFLALYTTSGRLVRILVDNEVKLAGVIHTENWDGTDDSGSMVGSGIYIAHLRIDDSYRSEKICFVK